MALLKLQADGKILSPVTQAAAKREYNSLTSAPRRTLHEIHSGIAPTIWASSTGYSYLIGVNKTNKTVAAIDTAANGCYNPTTVKVDHQRNVWLSCQVNSTFEVGAAQEYSGSGTLLNTYNAGCPSNIPVSLCAQFFSGTVDQAENANHVFVGLTFYVSCYGYYICNQASGGGVEFWNANQPSAQPTVNPFNLSGITLYGSAYFDVDASDNIYYTYSGCENVYPYTCGDGLAEYADATNASGAQTVLLPPGSIGTYGGVTISNHGKVLNVIDQSARTITQYALPWTGTPLRTLGPTLANTFGYGDPVSGGFNRSDSKMIVGDAYGWFNGIAVKSNTAKIHPTADCSGGGCYGASYTPSDK